MTEETVVNENVNLFIPITKVDVERREVWGYATIEQADNAAEILDYETSKPYFLEWSQQAHKRSGGKSKGNLRSMHEAIAAGKLIDLQADDTRRGIYIGAKIVDDNEWQKAQEGVYTGFSVGGKYIRRWPDRQPGLIRYTAKPGEISLVDAPCVPDATFDVIKGEGVEQRLFKADGQGGQRLQLDSTPAQTTTINSGGQDFTLTYDGSTISVSLAKQNNEMKAPENVEPQILPWEVAGQPVEQVQAQLKPFEINPENVPSGQALANAGAPAQSLEAMAAPIVPQTPVTDNRVPMIKIKSKPKVKVKMSKQLKKEDIANLIQGAGSMVASVREQAAAGEIDQALLDQVAGALEIAVDYVESMESAEGMQMSDVAPALDATVQDAPEIIKEGEMNAQTEGEEIPEGDMPEPPTTAKPKNEGIEDKGTPMEKTQLNKNGDEPLATRPPAPYMYFQSSEDQMASRMPHFIQALEAGSLRKAQELSERNQQLFDKMFNLALRHEMDQMGFHSRNIKKIHSGASTSYDPSDLQKSITAGDIPGINLLRLARLMLPVYAGLSRRLPAQTPSTGSDQATWRAQLGFGSMDFAGLMSVAEAAIGEASAESFLTFNAPYKDTTINDQVTLKSTFSSRGYDDPLQVATIYSLSALLQARERNIIGQNAAALSAPGSVTANPVASGGSLADGSYTITVTALTYRGWLTIQGGATPGGLSAVGETTGTASSAAVVAGGGGSGSVEATWSAVVGAVAYNVYATLSGTTRFVATVTVPAYTLTAFPASGNVVPVSNSTANSNGYEGLIQWCEQSTVYSNAIPNKVTPTDLGGDALTTSNSGIVEFDSVLENLWTDWQINPSLIVCSPRGAKNVTNLLMSLNNAALYRIEISGERGNVQGGAFVTGYVNSFAPFADGTPRYVDIVPHPYMPDGSFLFVTETVPYPMSREARGFAVEQLIPFTYFPLAQTTLVYPFAVTVSETVECFHPSAQTAITGVDVSGN